MLGLGTALAASAQMYKCTGADGKPSYRDRPCDAGSRQRDVGDEMSGRVPAVRYYELRSQDWASMRAEIDARAPKGYHGLASWQVRYNYRWNPTSDGQCSVTAVVPEFAGEILMPRWVPGPAVSADQRARWERYSAALKLHEDGHVAHGKQLASALAQISGLRADCGSIAAAVKARADALIRRYSGADAEYDRQTNHGETQGAVLGR